MRLIFSLLIVILSAIGVFRVLSFLTKDIITPTDITVNDFYGDDGEPETLRQFDKPSIDSNNWSGNTNIE